MQINNSASSKPERFFGRHFSPGVVNYPEHDSMLYVSPEVAKAMDPSFAGCPLYINHVDNNKINFTEAHGNADGWVVKSFYEPLDGSHWVEFLAITDDAKEKIKDGWTLSNSYNITDHGDGGQWHNVDYEIEVKNGKYGHLSLVDNSRYEESIIYTPEEFKAYQQRLRSQIESVKNSKGESKMSLFFKKEKVTKLDNEKDIAALSVILPKSKREVTITQLMNEIDAAEMAKADTSAKYANEADMIKIGDEEISVKDLVAKVMEFMASVEGADDESEDDAAPVESVENADDDEEEPADDKKDKKDKKDNSKSGLSLLKAAKKPLPTVVENTAPKRVSLKEQLAMGKERY